MQLGRDSLSKFTFAIASAACAIAFAAPASGAATPAGQIDLDSVRAERPVRDTVRIADELRATALRSTARAAYTDSKGVAIHIDTTVSGYNLDLAAAVLNSTVHGAELAKVKIHAVTLAEIPGICGDPEALACYLGNSRGFGEIWFAANDSDWIHSLVHEYGHHIDNQIANFSQLAAYGFSQGCSVGTDGTRSWYFERIGAANTTDSDRFFCKGTDWEHLLPELYAEDFVVLNGINGWQLSSAQAPNGTQLKAMAFDIGHKLFRSTKVFTHKIRHHRVFWKRVNTSAYSFLSVKASGARGRDFDLYVYPASSDEQWDKAAHPGRTEKLGTFLYPGKWDLGIAAYGKAGAARVEIRLR